MDCAQAETITDIKETLKTVAQAVNRIAVQDERLLNLTKKDEELEGDVNILYERVRKVETILGLDGDGIRLKVHDAFAPFMEQTERLGRFLDIVTSRAFVMVAVSLAVMVLVGSLCDLAYHANMMLLLFNKFKSIWAAIPK